MHHVNFIRQLCRREQKEEGKGRRKRKKRTKEEKQKKKSKRRETKEEKQTEEETIKNGRLCNIRRTIRIRSDQLGKLGM